MARLVLIDAHSIIHRAYHAIPPLTTTRGELVNAVYGFASTLLKVFAELKPDYVAVAIDLPAPTFRHERYKEYKAQRAEMDEALSPQFAKTHEILDAFNIPYFGVEGFEADDILGTLASKAVGKPTTDYSLRKKAVDGSQKAVDEVIIVSGDRDALQLVTDQVKVYMPARTMADTVLYDKARVKNRFGLEPEQLIDFKALAGDATDNIPGVLGIGEVSATKLLAEFGTLENLYKNLDKVPEKIRTKLQEGKESAFLSKQLVTILKNIPIKFDLDKCELGDYDKQKVIDLFFEFEFKSLIPRLPSSINKAKSESGELTSRTVLATNDLDKKLEPILEKMSDTGVLIDTAVLKKLGDKFGKRLNELEKKIYKEVGHDFNLNSPKQLSQVLYGEIHLAPVKKTKTGLSTDEATLQSLRGAHPVISLLLEYRELFKLKSTYIDALPKSIGKDGRIHSTFRLDVTATGRLSSQNPNLQNIPIRGEWGTAIRSAFIAPKGHVLLSADYSQIELRIMAHISGDRALKEAFDKGLDIHAATAAKIFNKPLIKVTTEDRRVAKILNFGLMFGLSAHGLSQQIGVDHAQASKLLEEYFAEFPRVADYMEETIKEARERGYVETLSGRRRYIPELAASNARIRAAGERMAVNTPIQGSEADIIKKAMVDIDEEFRDKKLGTRMILQVHDELLFEVPEKELKTVAALVKDKMESAFKLSVPIVVDFKVGKNWGEMKGIKNEKFKIKN